MIYLAEPNLTGNEKKYLNECIDTTFVSSVGAFVTRFEEDIAKLSGAAYGTACSAGTTGLELALRACGVEAGELVLIPSFTFIATANAVAHCGAEPWLVDIDESWTMDSEKLENELVTKTYERNGKRYHKFSDKRVAAIMPVYTLGMPADMDKIRAVADRYQLPLIADAAAALGARYKNRNIGQLADATVFSFNGNKTITCGGGGAVVSEHEEIISLAKHLATTARCGEEYDHDMVGYNYRMTNIQAAVGCAQLERLDEFVSAKKKISDYYREELKDVQGIKFFPETEWAESAHWFSGVLLSSDYEVRKVCEALKQKEIQTKTFWKPIHMQKPYLMSERSGMEVTETIWEHVLTLPSSTGITDEQLEKVVLALKEIL